VTWKTLISFSLASVCFALIAPLAYGEKPSSQPEVDSLRKELAECKDLIGQLSKRIQSLETRLEQLERRSAVVYPRRARDNRLPRRGGVNEGMMIDALEHWKRIQNRLDPGGLRVVPLPPGHPFHWDRLDPPRRSGPPAGVDR
jgi:hypothetical protein